MKVISFDLDGTLVDRRFDDALWFKKIPRAFARKHKMSFAKAKRLVLRTYDEVGESRVEWYDLNYWLKRFGLESEKKRVLKELKHLVKPYPDVAPVLRSLKHRGFKLVVISNAVREFIELKLEAEGLKKFFWKTFSLTTDFRHLKSEEIFSRICRRLRIAPTSLVHVGDHYAFDYVAPRKIGVKTFLLDRSRKRKKRAAFVVKNLEEFEKKLEY